MKLPEPMIFLSFFATVVPIQIVSLDINKNTKNIPDSGIELVTRIIV